MWSPYDMWKTPHIVQSDIFPRKGDIKKRSFAKKYQNGSLELVEQLISLIILFLCVHRLDQPDLSRPNSADELSARTLMTLLNEISAIGT